MKIVVLDFENGSADIITVSRNIINKYGDVENYLTEHCGYNTSSCEWMYNDDIVINNFDDNDFSMDDSDLTMAQIRYSSHFLKYCHYENGRFILNHKWQGGNFQIDNILVSDSKVFGTKDEVSIDMEFYDGFALPQDEHQMVMLYPTMKYIKGNSDLYCMVEQYTGCELDDMTYYDICLRFGTAVKFEDMLEIMDDINDMEDDDDE